MQAVAELVRSQTLSVQPVTYADFDLFFGNFYYPSPGVDYTSICTVPTPFMVQFLDNGVDLWLKSFKPSVRCLASCRFVRRQLFQLRSQPLYRCR